LVIGPALQRMSPGAKNALSASGLKSDPAFVLWTQISSVATVIFGILLITSGIGLLLAKNWARILAIICAALDIVFVVIAGIFSQRVIASVVMQVHGISPGVAQVIVKIFFIFVVVIGMVYPVLLLIFMTRPHVTDACASAELPVENPLP
jgi:uncharacterized membrane protein (UPF0136 family)